MTSEVQGLIDSAKANAREAVESAKGALEDMVQTVGLVGYSEPKYTDVKSTTPPPPKSTGLDVPQLQPVVLTLPATPGPAPVFQSIKDIVDRGAPTFDTPAPSLTPPTKPAELGPGPGAAPTVNTQISFPEPPARLTNPVFVEPNITNRTEPTAPTVTVPEFSASMTGTKPQAPTDLTKSFELAYKDASPATITMVNGHVDAMMAKFNPNYATQLSRLEAQLAKYLDGGTGLDAAVENAIYERARGKNDAESRRVRDAAYKDAAARGFTLPSGAMASAIQQARQAGADNNARAASEIVVMQAEMEQKNLQFALNTIMTLRSTAVSATMSYMQNLISVNGQALDYAKTVLSSIIEVYNTSVKVFTLELEQYKAEAAVYESRLRAALAKIDIYQAEIKALEALTNVDKTKVEVYRAQIESLSSLANVYRAQIEAVTQKVSLEKLKLDVFLGQVQAYSAQVQAKNAEWQGYTAAFAGEEVKARTFATQASAYATEVQGYRAGIDAQMAVMNATVHTDAARSAQFESQLRGFMAEVQARSQKAQAEIENNRQVLQSFNAKVQLAVADQHIAAEAFSLNNQVNLANAKGNLEAQIAGADAKAKFGSVIAGLGTSSAQVYAQMAGSAMSGINALAGAVEYK